MNGSIGLQDHAKNMSGSPPLSMFRCFLLHRGGVTHLAPYALQIAVTEFLPILVSQVILKVMGVVIGILIFQ